jgi:hypothetical protein
LNQTTDRKRKGKNIINHTCRQPANNVIVDSEQAGLAESSDAASKRRRLDSEIDELHKLAKRARERRDHIREKITTLSQLSDNADQLPNAADQLSNPAFHDVLPFPFVGPAVPTRFRANADSENSWFYVGRETFMKLLGRLRYVQNAPDRTALWVYGTKGYGKSHLLAALVCYLAAQGERVVYIPDCRECVKRPVAYVRAAMLFAWADDKTMQDEIITLNTQGEIEHFFERHSNLTFFIDQVNGFEEQDNDVKRWLNSCRAWSKAVLSTLANYESYLKTAPKQSTEETYVVYNGFTLVSLSKEELLLRTGLF